MPAKTKDKATAGPAWTPAAFPVRTKMPVPITTPTPNTVRSSALSRLRSWCSGSSVSAMDCSIVLVRQRFTSITSSPGARTAAPLRVHRDTDGAYPGEPENTHRVRGPEDRFPVPAVPVRVPGGGVGGGRDGTVETRRARVLPGAAAAVGPVRPAL